MASTPLAGAENDPALNDLGPLAWVLDELRKSLDGATKAMNRFVRDAELARGSELSELDSSHLRVARQQLHQAVGALEMVGMPAPAKVLHAMESAVQKYVQRPEQCSDEAALCIERASFALTEYLEGVLKGKKASSVALFPQYRAVQELVAAERIHPADLWSVDWRWLPITLEASSRPLPYAPEVRALLDQAVLRIVKTGDPKAAGKLAQVCMALSSGQQALESRSFWAIAAAYFEAISLSLLPSDIYTKRTASRILQQYAALAKGDASPSERLAQDLVFFCSQAASQPAQHAPALSAVRAAYGLADSTPVDYELVQFGRFDPAQLAQARKRIASAAETWAALAGGDTGRLNLARDQFGAVSESILKLHPHSSALPQALTAVMDAVARTGAAPAPALAMEVATAVLYLEAAYDDLDPTDDQMVERGQRLAQRLQKVREGGESEPLEGWMEELYRRVSDRQTMGSVVDELRSALGDVEVSLDRFFRNPGDMTPLREVPSRLAQMRGVFSVLGLDQPAVAALRMRASVDRLLAGEIDLEQARTGLFEKLGNSLGALGLLIDMLSYQRAMAKKLFAYDEEAGEFKPLMGRERSLVPEVDVAAVEASAAAQAVAEPVALDAPDSVVPASPDVYERTVVMAPSTDAPPPALADAVAAPVDDDDDAELQDIFLEEARDVVGTGLSALVQLQEDPANLAEQTTLRRAFHTLKGSSRMVGLNDFGEAAWSFEQLMNAWLAEQKPASEDLINLAYSGMAALGRWVEDIAGGNATQWSALPFRKSSDALRLEGVLHPLQEPHTALTEGFGEREGGPTLEFAPTFMVETDEGEAAAVPEPESAVEPLVDLPDFAATMVSDMAPLAREPESPTAPEPEPDLLPMAAQDPLAEPFAIDFAATMAYDSTPVASAPPADAAAPDGVDLGEFDFGSADELSSEEGPETLIVPPVELDFGTDPLQPEHEEPLAAFEAPLSEPEEPMPVAEEPALVAEVPLAEPEVVAAPVEEEADAAADEQIKVIGDLRLGIPLYNVYLNEADEWSRRLITELAEWSLELHRPVPGDAVALAHSLAGSSGTVGFTALSEVARTLEHALEHVKLHGQANAFFAQTFSDAAEDIRRLLHQFAAGFLKTADGAVLQALKDILATEFPEVAGDELPETLEDFDSRHGVDTLAAEPEPEPEVAVIAEAPRAALAAPSEPSIDAVDHLDADLFPIFQEEAQELMPALGTALRQWVARPDNLGARSEALRVLHTLKGSARLAGAMRLGEMAHRMESGIEKLGSEDLAVDQLEPLLSRLDDLQNALDALDRAPREDIALASGPDSTLGPATLQPEESQPAEPTAEVPTPSETVATPPAVPVAPPLETVTRAASRGPSVQTVRVRAVLLDRLVNQAGEVMISRSRLDNRIVQMRTALAELTGNLDRLRAQLRDVELQAESQMQSRMAQTREDGHAFDPLEFDRFTRVQELTRMMAESVNDVATVQRNMQRAVESAEDELVAQGRQARELQRDVLRTRMVEFESIAERLYGVVRQSAKETGKQVKLEIVGGNIEMDRGVLDRMTPAFEHILRNAVAHGIESAEVRHLADKPPVGQIQVTVHQESNDVTVAFSDDGGGLHLDKIREKAIAAKLVEPGAELTSDAAAKLLFTPGFTTATQVTELSGRGIGMDVVLTELNGLGGRVDTRTEAGKGTTFSLVLPLTTAVTQVVLLRMGEFQIGVPANLMETVLRVSQADVDAAYERHAFQWNGHDMGFFWAGALLQVSGRSSEPPARNQPVAVFRSAGQRLALHVDEVLGNREVVVKNLGPQLAHMPGLSGMSVLASGAVVLIYNPVALATVYGDQARALSTAVVATPEGGSAVPALAPSGAVQAPLVLVVDDSITVRRVTQRLLKREGYRVTTANDGLHALEVLRNEKPAVVLSDIEMPRMDGFELVRNIRSSGALRDLPVIMITSRIAQKHRDHAAELGVNHYLGKPYSEDELLSLVRAYCAEATEA